MTPDFIQLAKQKKCRIILPEGCDSRILEAAVYADQNDIADIILLGKAKQINEALNGNKLSQGNIQIIDPENNEHSQLFADTLFQLRSKKGLSKDQADTYSRQPLYCANLMLRAGLADGCVAGAINLTGDVIRSALQVIGTESNESRLSSFFIMLLSDTTLNPVIFADCAINISPDASQLADIAFQSAKNAKELLGLDPKIAMLSFSTNGSAKHENVDKVRQATALLNQQHPELTAIGDIQFDAAISPDILNKKWPGTDFKAPANVFVFPSLEAGNIGYKIAERFGGATAIGPILQGLAKPVNDLSRGANVESIINTIAVTCLQVNSKP